MIWQALGVVVIANALAAVGSWIGYENTAGEGMWDSIRQWTGIGGFPIPTEGGVVAVVGLGILSAVVGWIVWAATTSFIGTRLFKGTTDMGEMLRVLGFAQAPRVIGLIPFLGPVRGGVGARCLRGSDSGGSRLHDSSCNRHGDRRMADLDRAATGDLSPPLRIRLTPRTQGSPSRM